MHTRHMSYALIAALAWASCPGAGWPQEPTLEPIPVEGALSPEGRFVGTLTIETVTVTDAGRLGLQEQSPENLR
jgi:hypothetical protein